MHANASLPLAQRMTPTQRILSIFFSFFCNRFFKRIFHDVWLPSGGPKSTQTRLFPEKATPRSDLFVTFVATAIVLAFFVNFWSKLQEKTMKKKTCFVTSVFVFCNMANP